MSEYLWNTKKAILFSYLASRLEIWAYEKGYLLTRGWAKRTQTIQKEIYGEMRPTLHEWCRAQDYTLFIINSEGRYVWIKDGNHPAWKKIADKAEELGLKSGRKWDDINHVELG
ncbi:hypothetical protein GOV14_03525 [Candidatus Pacearchaeota archaeon]|nr:hypothetical protein [Candidatus Pacearchaeota archaeon]